MPNAELDDSRKAVGKLALLGLKGPWQEKREILIGKMNPGVGPLKLLLSPPET